MIVLYNQLKKIYKKKSPLSLSSLRLIESKNISIPNARNDIALNASIIIWLAYFYIV